MDNISVFLRCLEEDADKLCKQATKDNAFVGSVIRYKLVPHLLHIHQLLRNNNYFSTNVYKKKTNDMI